MKNFILLLLVFTSISGIKAQDQKIFDSISPKKFHAGIFYSFSGNLNKITGLSMHSIWYGQDLGTISFDDKEIDSLNGLRNELMNLQLLSLNFGMVICHHRNWDISADLFAGISKTFFETDLALPANNKMKMLSEFKNPSVGASMKIRYILSNRWSICLNPFVNYIWGKSNTIKDSIQPYVFFFINDLEEKFTIGYCRLGLLGSFQINRLSISLGPGFYYAGSRRTYSIDRTDPESLQTYHDEIKSSFSTSSFVDCCLRAEWNIIAPITVSAELAAGNDLFTQACLYYNF